MEITNQLVLKYAPKNTLSTLKWALTGMNLLDKVEFVQQVNEFITGLKDPNVLLDLEDAHELLVAFGQPVTQSFVCRVLNSVCEGGSAALAAELYISERWEQ